MKGLVVTALLAVTAAGPSPGDDQMESLLAACSAERGAYWQALANVNPPEIVELTMAELLSDLKGLPTWNEVEIARRQAQDARAIAADAETLRANPALAQAARLGQCLTGAEWRRRKKSAP